MSDQRPSLGFDSELESFNPDEWKPKAKPKPKAARKNAATAAEQSAEAVGFKSREVAPQQAKKRPQRLRTTGRNQQFNMKAKQETIDAFYEVADANDWGLGETLEHAVALLKKHHG